MIKKLKEEGEQRQLEKNLKNDSAVEIVEFIVAHGDPKRTDGSSTDKVNYE